MKTTCFWTHPEYVPSEKLTGPAQTEYLIVGGGIAGLFTAYHLLESGISDIVLIEKETVGSGSTGHSAGMLVAEIETASWSELAKAYGQEGARLYWQAQKETQDLVHKLIREERIDCEHSVDDFLYLAHNTKERHALLSEFNLRESMGTEPELLEGKAADQELHTDAFPFIEKIETSHSVHPLRFAHGLKELLQRRGVRVYEHTPLETTEGNLATTPEGTISFNKCIYALGTQENHSSVENYITTICVTRPLTDTELEQLHLSDKDMFLGMGTRSYHYGKVTGDNRLLIGYGDVLDMNPEEKVHLPHIHSVEHFIETALNPDITIEYAWSAPYALSKELLPIVEKNGDTGRIAGAGTQIASAVAAEYLVSQFTNTSHKLDPLFKKEI